MPFGIGKKSNGESAPHIAAHFCNATITSTLLRAGANTDDRNHRGGDPEHVAACSGCAPTVSMLLNAGNNPRPWGMQVRWPTQVLPAASTCPVVKVDRKFFRLETSNCLRRAAFRLMCCADKCVLVKEGTTTGRNEVTMVTSCFHLDAGMACRVLNGSFPLHLAALKQTCTSWRC